VTVELDHADLGDPAAPPVVLLGALGTDLTIWEPQTVPLSTRFRVLPVDLRGHGRSPSPAGPYSIAEMAGDVVALLDADHIESAHVVGIGLGSVVGQRLAAQHPTRVRTLTLVDTSPTHTPADEWAERARTVRAGGTEAIASGVVANWFTEGLRANDPDLVRHHREIVEKMSDEGCAACCDALSAWDGGRHDRARIVAPTLVVRPGDESAPADEPPVTWPDEIAGCVVRTVGACGELATVEQAGQVTALLIEHLSAYSRATVETGMRIRRAVLGDAHVDRSIAESTEFTAPFQDFITRTAWGDVWSRPGLDHSTRRLLTLAILTAVGNEHELDMHIRAALRAGTDPDDLVEVFLHTAVYAGVPNTNRAFALGKKAIADLAAESP